MDGFEMTSGAEAKLYQHMSHFFTTGVPEITYFGPENSLETHGARMTALHFIHGGAKIAALACGQRVYACGHRGHLTNQ
jgi:hypothetical protein